MLLLERGKAVNSVRRTLCPLSNMPARTQKLQRNVAFYCKSVKSLLVRQLRETENCCMKGLAIILVAAAAAYAAFHYYFQKMPTTDEGTAPTQAITLTGVRADLLQIATAERAFVALNSHCAPLGELSSSSDLPVPRSGRDGYTYSVECSGEQFTVSARHKPALGGSSIRYPNFSVDDNMQVNEVN